MPNPEFDPSKYDPAQEGKAGLKGGANRAQKGRARQRGKPVAGWQPGGTCKLSVRSGTLLVESTGKDPYLICQLPNAVDVSPLTLQIRMKSTSSGRGQVFWRVPGRPYSAERSHAFDVKHDANAHEYAIQFTPKAPVQGIRIDPSRGSGKIEISKLRLIGNDGKIIHQWSF